MCHQFVVINAWGNSCLHCGFNLAHCRKKWKGWLDHFRCSWQTFLKVNLELKLTYDNLIDLIFKGGYFV